MKMDDSDYVQIQDRADELIYRIMARIGELFLTKELGSGDGNLTFPSVFGPRHDIRQVIVGWLVDEKEKESVDEKEKEDG